MKEEVGYFVKHISDVEHKELTPDWIYQIFEDKYVNNTTVFSIPEVHFKQSDGITADVTIRCGYGQQSVCAKGNGRLDAVSNAVKDYFNLDYELIVYEEHALSRGSSSKAAAYVGISLDNKTYWGVGFDEDIIKASIGALAAAVNQLESVKDSKESKMDERMAAIICYIQNNYHTVTLDELSEEKAILDLQKSMVYEFTTKMNALHKHKKFSKPVILAMDYIFSNLNQKLTVQLIADQVKRNPDYISRLFNKETGQTLSTYIREKRIEAAKNMLVYSDTPVSDIAQYLNFNSHSHFTEVFKKVEKVTPKEYRELHFRRNFT
jgi:2-isopropylmalate synthase